MMTFESILGQAGPIRVLTQMLRRNRLPHSLLFTGIDGIGKQTTAGALAMALNCLNPVGVSGCGKCRSCQKVISGNHPDVITVRPDGAFIKIDQVRNMCKQLRFAPVEGKWRVVIIQSAHRMNAEAANAILKVLEEPPDATVIILTANQTPDLLPTIVSRCRHIPFRPIPTEKIADRLVVSRGLSRETAVILAILARGSLGMALSADVDSWMDWRKSILQRIKSASGESIRSLFAFASALANDKNRLDDALCLIAVWFRDVLIYKLCPEKLVNKDFVEDIGRAAKRESIDQILEKMQVVFSAQAAIRRNANRRLTSEVMMMQLFKT